ERGWHEFQLLARFAAEFTALLAAAGTGQRCARQLIHSLLARQVLRQRSAAMTLLTALVRGLLVYFRQRGLGNRGMLDERRRHFAGQRFEFLDGEDGELRGINVFPPRSIMLPQELRDAMFLLL